MKTFKVMLLAISVILLFSTFSMAQWSRCKGCHNGTMASGSDALKEKYKTADELVKGALATKSPMMKWIQNNEKVAKEAAKDIGLK